MNLFRVAVVRSYAAVALLTASASLSLVAPAPAAARTDGDWRGEHHADGDEAAGTGAGDYDDESNHGSAGDGSANATGTYGGPNDAEEEDADTGAAVTPSLAPPTTVQSAVPTRANLPAPQTKAPATASAPASAKSPAPANDNFFLRAPTPVAGPDSSFVHATLVATGTIVDAGRTYSVLQSGVHLRAARFVGHRLFVAGDVELNGGAGSAAGSDRFGFNVGAALGILLPVHERLSLLPSLGLGYGLLKIGTSPGIDTRVEHGLLLDLRFGLLTPITPRLHLLVAPLIQPTLVHSGKGVMEGPHVTLGLTAGVACWF